MEGDAGYENLKAWAQVEEFEQYRATLESLAKSPASYMNACMIRDCSGSYHDYHRADCPWMLRHDAQQVLVNKYGRCNSDTTCPRPAKFADGKCWEHHKEVL